MPQPFESALIAAGIQGIEGQDWRTTKTNISVGVPCGRLKRRPNKGNHEWLRLRRLIPQMFEFVAVAHISTSD